MAKRAPAKRRTSSKRVAAKRTSTRRTTKKRQTHDWRRLLPWGVGIAALVLIIVFLGVPTAQFQDTDGDGLSNAEEPIWGTDAGNPDTDGDGCLDGAEARVYCTDVLTQDCDPVITSPSETCPE